MVNFERGHCRIRDALDDSRAIDVEAPRRRATVTGAEYLPQAGRAGMS